MAIIIKDPIDGVMRTAPEQITKNAEDIGAIKAVNAVFAQEISDLQTASNIGGGNLVRFAFKTDGSNDYSQFLSSYSLDVSGFTDLQNGDAIEIMSTDGNNIPAYGYILNGVFEFTFLGDYDNETRILTAINMRTGESVDLADHTFVQFSGTRLGDKDANASKAQIVNVLMDMDRGGVKDQYTSADFNGDGIYEWYYIGTSSLQGEKGDKGDQGDQGDKGDTGADGVDALVCSGTIYDDTSDTAPPTSTVFLVSNFNKTPIVDETFTTIVRNEISLKSWQANYKVDTIDGVSVNCSYLNSVETTGNQGEQGAQGDVAPTLTMQDGEWTPTTLPDFSTVNVNDGYFVSNTVDGVIEHYLYYKAEGGTDWRVIDNVNYIGGTAPTISFVSHSLPAGSQSYSVTTKTGVSAYQVDLYLATGAGGATPDLADYAKQADLDATNTSVLSNTNNIATLSTSVENSETEISNINDKIEDLDSGKVDTYTEHIGVDYKSYHYVDNFSVNMVLSDDGDYTFVNCAGAINVNSTFTGSLSISGCPRLTISGISLTQLGNGAKFSGVPLYSYTVTVLGSDDIGNRVSICYTAKIPCDLGSSTVTSTPRDSNLYKLLTVQGNTAVSSTVSAMGGQYDGGLIYPMLSIYVSSNSIYFRVMAGAYIETYSLVPTNSYSFAQSSKLSI